MHRSPHPLSMIKAANVLLLQPHEGIWESLTPLDRTGWIVRSEVHLPTLNDQWNSVVVVYALQIPKDQNCKKRGDDEFVRFFPPQIHPILVLVQRTKLVERPGIPSTSSQPPSKNGSISGRIYFLHESLNSSCLHYLRLFNITLQFMFHPSERLYGRETYPRRRSMLLQFCSFFFYLLNSLSLFISF